MSKPLRIRLTKATGAWPKDTELGVASLADAERLYPNHDVVSYTDGSPYEAPKESAAKSGSTTPKTDDVHDR